MVKPRKVLFFRPSLGQGGADRVTATLLRRLDRERFDPSIALVRVEGEFLPDVPPDVVVHALGSRRLATSVPALMRLIRKTQPDVIFSTASACNPIAVFAHRLARSRAKLVLSERNALFRGRANDFKQRVEVALKKITYNRADVVTTVSSGLADQLAADIGVKRSKLQVVYNPMIDDDLDARAAEPVEHPWFSPEQLPVVVACARLVEQKDYPALLAAFAKVRAQLPARLFVLGEGPLKATLEEEARRLGIGADVCFFGFDKNPMKYMSRARILMHASRAEGLPGSLIQTMACGTPVVSTDCDFGPREVITESGVDGYLVRVGDTDALAARSLGLLTQPALRDSMGQRAKISAGRFTVAASLARYEAALGA
ncbi:MAG: glycosyltransferase [Myxococcota bacterium]|nr:glycosyltransferase [Myxococcota bacterium]